MKFITDDAAYVQKYYFAILMKSTLVTDEGIPMSMCEIVNKKSFDKYGHKDFIKFTKATEIEFLRKANWIPDYNDYIEKTIEEIKEEMADLNNEGTKLNEWFKNLSQEEKQCNQGYGFIRGKMLMYKMESLKDIIALKEKNITPVLEEAGLIQKIRRLFHR